MLCLAVQGIIFIEFGLSVYSFRFMENFDGRVLLQGVLATVVVILLWVFLKPILQKSQQVAPLKNELRKFRNNPELFLSLLQKQPEMPILTPNVKPVLIGKQNAEHTITMVTNPFCQPCANAHEAIEKLIENNENLNCQVIFFASNIEGDKRGIVARCILSLPKQKQAKALSEWYKNEERSIEKWQMQFEIVEKEKPFQIIEQHSTWCKLAKIEVTPTLYLDGFKMPELYRLEDLKGVLKYLPTVDFAKS